MRPETNRDEAETVSPCLNLQSGESRDQRRRGPLGPSRCLARCLRSGSFPSEWAFAGCAEPRVSRVFRVFQQPIAESTRNGQIAEFCGIHKKSADHGLPRWRLRLGCQKRSEPSGCTYLGGT